MNGSTPSPASSVSLHRGLHRSTINQALKETWGNPFVKTFRILRRIKLEYLVYISAMKGDKCVWEKLIFKDAYCTKVLFFTAFLFLHNPICQPFLIYIIKNICIVSVLSFRTSCLGRTNMRSTAWAAWSTTTSSTSSAWRRGTTTWTWSCGSSPPTTTR